MPFLLFMLLGIIIGVIGTIVGIGGGFILMPVLLVLYPKENADLLTSISLAVIFFNSLSGTIAYGRMKRIDYQSGILFAAATVPGAILGSLTVGYLPRNAFNIIFAVLMVIASVYLLYKQRTSPVSSAKIKEKKYKYRMLGRDFFFDYNPAAGVVISFFTGYLASILGIGGGIIHVPFLIHVLDFTVHSATATSHFVLAIMSFVSTLVHLIHGDLNTKIAWLIFPVSIGVIGGAQLGARLSARVNGAWIIRGLAVILVVVAGRLLYYSLFMAH